MKALITSDWHGDWKTAGLDRYGEIESASQKTVRAAVEHNVNLYCFLGDLSDPDNQSSHRTVALAIRTMWELDAAFIQSIWIAGNHDVIEDGTGVTCLRPLQEAAAVCDEITGVYERPAVHTMSNDTTQVLVLPYVARSHAYDPVHFVETVDAPNVRLVLGHLTVAGAGMGTEVTDMPRGRDVMLPVDAIRKRWPRAVIANGHHHTAQYTNGVHIPGNLARLTHGEEGNDPGYLILEF